MTGLENACDKLSVTEGFIELGPKEPQAKVKPLFTFFQKLGKFQVDNLNSENAMYGGSRLVELNYTTTHVF